MTRRDLDAERREQALRDGVELPGVPGTVTITLAPAAQAPPFYQVGTLLEVTVSFKDLSGTPTEPAEATLHSLAPEEDAPPVEIALTKTGGTGVFTGQVSLEEAGTWWLRATGGSPGPVSEVPVEVELAHV
jgi:hypothetical protein